MSEDREAMLKELKALQAEFRQLRKMADEKEAKIQELIRQIDLSRTPPETEQLFE
jgi:endonuclease III